MTLSFSLFIVTLFLKSVFLDLKIPDYIMFLPKLDFLGLPKAPILDLKLNSILETP